MDEEKRKKKAEKKRIYDKKYRKENAERLNEKQQKYLQSEKGKEVRQKYAQSEKGKEVKQKSQQKYYNTEHGKKVRRIKNWESSGVKSDDWDALYEYYFNCWECENCGVELIEGLYGNNKKCLDHCHKTGEFRNVLCNFCNLLRDK